MKTALITGASSGIGYELAKEFAQAGNNLVLVARTVKTMEELANKLKTEFKIQVEIIGADLSIESETKKVFDLVQDKKIKIDYLINNAGFGDFAFFHEADWSKLNKMIQLNITSLTYLTKLFLPDMIAQKSGRIMNVASTAAFIPCPLMDVYAATKHYVLAFSEALANEVKDKGITVTALCPGATSSGFQDAAAMRESGFMKQNFVSSASVAKFGFKAMMNGKTVAIPGFMNKLTAFATRLLPRNLVTKSARKVIDRK